MTKHRTRALAALLLLTILWVPVERKALQLRCDEPSCEAAYTDPHDLERSDLVRWDAWMRGWKHDGKRDFCPDHSPPGSGKDAAP
jgi:hypothetical protein